MSDTRSLITQIASENNIEATRVQGSIERLLEEWYETSESLKEITDSQWVSFGVPSRLVELIKKTLETEEAPRQVQSLPNSIDLLLEEIIAKDQNETRTCFETLKTILGNILKSSDPKFRRIKKTNPNFFNKVGKYINSEGLLKEIGFEEDSEFYILNREDQGVINETVSKIEEILQNLVAFDPYVASVTSIGTDALKLNSLENKNYEINSEIKKIASQEVPKVNREPKIVKVNSENVQAYFRKIDLEPVENENEKEDEVSQLAIIQNVMRQREELSNFKSKRKNALNAAIKEASFVKVTIRIRFPDKNVLQGFFSVNEKAKDIYEFVKEFLVLKQREFYLYEAPPKRVINCGGHNLKPFAPASLVYFGWKDLQETTESHGPFLESIRT